MIINCMVYQKKWNNKPAGLEIAECRNNLKPASIEIEELAILLCQGGTFTPAVLNGTTDDSWTSQQLFAFDFDHETTIETELERCRRLGLIPVFGYTTHNHKIEKHNFEDRFRLVFCCNKEITDIYTRNKVMLSLANAFFNEDKTNIDTSTFNPNRIFFGGKSGVPFFTDYESRIDIDKLLETYCSIEIENKSKSMKEKKTKATEVKNNKDKVKTGIKRNVNLHIEAIKKLDVESLKLLINQAIEREDKLHTDKEENISYSISMDSIPPFMGGSTVGTGGNAVGSDKASIIVKSSAEVYSYINSIDLGLYLNVDSDGTLV